MTFDRDRYRRTLREAKHDFDTGANPGTDAYAELVSYAIDEIPPLLAEVDALAARAEAAEAERDEANARTTSWMGDYDVVRDARDTAASERHEALVQRDTAVSALAQAREEARREAIELSCARLSVMSGTGGFTLEGRDALHEAISALRALVTAEEKPDE